MNHKSKKGEDENAIVLKSKVKDLENEVAKLKQVVFQEYLSFYV